MFQGIEEFEGAYFDEESREYVFEDVSTTGRVRETAARKSLQGQKRMKYEGKANGWVFEVHFRRFEIYAEYNEREDDIRVSLDGMRVSKMRELALEGNLNRHPDRDSLYDLVRYERSSDRVPASEL